ncbi:MAG: hypothetical protein SGJ20_18855 [Planctomycetota bacterium]|nr:hypothetical protein [Planctomycetota bacterium]
MIWTRRNFLRSLAVLGTAPLIGIANAANSPLDGSADEFRKVLNAGLQSRLPSEFAFVDLVVQKVEAGTLPRSLVESTFFWARRHPPYPFPYFRTGLKLRAKKIGVVL